MDNDNPCERIKEHLSDYRCASIYAVHRKEVYDRLTKMLSIGRQYSTAASLELQVSVVSAWLGKLKVLDQLMWLRNRENKSHHLINNTVNPWTWIADNKYKEEINNFVIDFDVIFPEESNIKNCVKKALKLFSSKMKEKKKEFLKFLNGFFYIWSWLHESIKSIIRPLIGTNKSLIDMASSLQNKGVKVDQTELKSVDKFLSLTNELK